MLPLAPLLLLKSTGGFIARHWEIFAIAACLIVWHVVFYHWAQRREREEWIPKVEALERQVADHRAASEQAIKDRQADEEAGKIRNQKVIEHAQERIHASNAASDSLRDELRRARSALRPLAPAAAAPAACRDYEASPRQLSERHAEFLVGFATRCSITAGQLTTCQEYAVDLHSRCSAPPP
jgi:hypothetical protein